MVTDGIARANLTVPRVNREQQAGLRKEIRSRGSAKFDSPSPCGQHARKISAADDAVSIGIT